MNILKPRLLSAALISVGFLIVSGCGSDSSDNPDVDASIRSKAGYSIIEPIAYRFQNQESGVLDLKTSESRIWYSYQPADADVNSKPSAIPGLLKSLYGSMYYDGASWLRICLFWGHWI